MKTAILALILLPLSGCAFMKEAFAYHEREIPEPPRVEELTPDEAAVRVMKADPPDGYTDVGPISSASGRGCGAFGEQGTFDLVMIRFKKAAFAKGASYVQLLTITEPHSENGCFDNQYKLAGIAYRKP